MGLIKAVLDALKKLIQPLNLSLKKVEEEEKERARHAIANATKAIEADIYKEVDKALAEGMTYRQFANNLTPILQAKGWWGKGKGSPWRLSIIYDTNMRVARARGQWQRIQQRKSTHPYLVYELGASKEHRPHHVRWSGYIAHVDDEFWLTHFPPNGFGCKCHIRQITEQEAEKLLKETGYIDYRKGVPKQVLVAWKNKKTGKTEMVPEGVDMGFANNPGIDSV